jgi:hypothetical protein
LIQAFLKKWWVESDFKAPNLPLSLRFKNKYDLLPCTKKNLQQARVNIPLLPALKVNIIIVHPRGVVFPRI